MKNPPFFLFILLAISLTACCELTGECEVKTEDDAGTEVVEDNTRPIVAGCWSASYNNATTSQLGCGLLNSLGDSQLDQLFKQEVQIQTTFWNGVPARVWVINECSGTKNAISMPSGDILFGINMFWDVIYTTGSTLPVASVLAHEWGHQIQFIFNWMNNNEPTVRRTELEADAFSGYYMILAKSWASNQINTFFQALYNIGDYQYNNRNHHGTPEERVSAGYMGVNTAIYAIQNRVSFSYQDLHTIFTSQISINTGKTDAKEALPDRLKNVVEYLDTIGNRIDVSSYEQLAWEDRMTLFPSNQF